MEITDFTREIINNEVIEKYKINNPHIASITNRFPAKSNNKTTLTDLLKIMVYDYLKNVKKCGI